MCLFFIPTIAPEMQPMGIALSFYSLEGNIGFPLMLRKVTFVEPQPSNIDSGFMCSQDNQAQHDSPSLLSSATSDSESSDKEETSVTLVAHTILCDCKHHTHQPKTTPTYHVMAYKTNKKIV